MNDRFTVRALRPEDALLYAAHRAEALLDSPWAFLAAPGDDAAGNAEAVARNLADPENVIVGAFRADPAAAGASVLLGTAGVQRSRRYKTRHRAMIWGVYVTPGARGRGVGKGVVSAAIDAAAAWPGVETVSLSVSERSEAARALYRRLGFVEWGREPDLLRIDGDGYDEIHMQRRVRLG